jgi:hypothetical protein
MKSRAHLSVVIAPVLSETEAAQGQTEEAQAQTEVDLRPWRKALGMSILGNQQAPKGLVIIPWKALGAWQRLRHLKGA